MRTSLLSALTFVSIALVACAGRGASGKTARTPVAAASSGSTGTKAGAVPTILLDIEDTAEDAFDHALAGNVLAVRADASKLATSWSSFRATAIADGVSQADAASLDAAIAALPQAASANKTPVELARAADTVSAPMDRLFAVYNPASPPVLLKLDYLGREVQLDARSSDFSGASTHRSEAAAAWNAIRSQVESKGGATQATEFDASLASMDAAIQAKDATALESAAVHELNLVDDIEKLF